MRLVRQESLLDSAKALEMSKEHRDVVMKIEESRIIVRFQQKPSEAVLAFLRENGFRWNRERKEWYCNVEAFEVESEEERRSAEDDFASILDVLANRQRAAKLFTQALAEKILQTLDGMRVLLLDSTRQVAEIYE